MGVQIFTGDVRGTLSRLQDNYFQCCVTSPPYYGLRDYGIEGQIGHEKTPAQYVETMVGVFREVRRVLRPDWVCFLNIGDASSSNQDALRSNAPELKPKDLILVPERLAIALQEDGWYVRSRIAWCRTNIHMGSSIPWSPTRTETAGWEPSCACGLEPIPCAVIDPFGGSGTTGMVADRMGRSAVLIELNPSYVPIMLKRISEHK